MGSLRAGRDSIDRLEWSPLTEVELFCDLGRILRWWRLDTQGYWVLEMCLIQLRN